MSVNNETHHQVHLDQRKFDSNCEDCWNSPVEAFAPFAKFHSSENVSNLGKGMPLNELDAPTKINSYMWAMKVLGRKPF